jgi:antitoxin YefM
MTYTQLRDKLASVLDHVAAEREVVIVRRKGAKDVALIPADELASIMETAHLLRSPNNASRLLRAFRRAEKGSRLLKIALSDRVGENAPPSSVDIGEVT